MHTGGVSVAGQAVEQPYFRVLGPLGVELDGRPLSLGGRLRRALLADLLLHANEVVSVDRLVEDLWGGSPPDDPVNTIQVYVRQLRRLLEPARTRRETARVLTWVPPGYQLVVDDEHLDALEFEALVAAGREALAADRVDPARKLLNDALALWRGSVLPEFSDAEFARTHMSRLDELRLSALEDRIDADLAVGKHAHVVGEIEGLTAQHPFRERFWELRMLALHRADRPVDALRAYDEVSRLLGDELAMEPGPRLHDLRWRIARRDPGLDEVRRPRIAAARVEPRATERFVGRQAELTQLRDLLEHARAGHRELATVVAEAGAGKSRLVAELVTWAWTRGCVVGSGRCFEAETGPPFAPVVECLVELVGSVDPAAIRSEAERPAAVVARLIPELHELLGELPEPATLPPEEDRARLFDAIARVVVAATRLAPTVLVLDDLQWADVSTLALTAYLARAAKESPLLIVGCYRSDEVDAADTRGLALAALEREGTATRITLGPLQEMEASLLVSDVLGSAAEPAVVAALVARGRGHPFFLRELARDALDGVLDAAAVPVRARDLVLQRLHRFAPPCQRFVAAASVFDGPFDALIAAAAAGLAEEEALDALDALVLGGLMIPATGGSNQFEFVHDIARQTISETLTGLGRARLHRAVAAAMEEQWAPARQRRFAASIAGHYARSTGLTGTARGAVYAEMAATAAEAAHAYADAVRLLELALELLAPDDPSEPRLLSRLGRAQIAGGDEGPGLTALLDAAARIAAAEGRAAAAGVLADATTHAVQVGAWSAAPELASAGLSYVDDETSATWVALALADLIATGITDPNWPGLILGTPDQLRLSAALRSLPASERPAVSSTLLLAFTSRADVLATVPDEPEALVFWAGEYWRALELVAPRAAEDEEAGRIETAIVHRCTEARCLNALGRFEESDVAFARAADLVRRLVGRSIFAAHLLAVDDERASATGEGWGKYRIDLRDLIDPRWLHWYSVSRRSATARTMANLGDIDGALHHLAPTFAALDAAPPWSENYVRLLHAAAEIHWLGNRVDHAALIERNVRDTLFGPDFRYPMTDLRLTLARLVAVQGRLDEAARWFDQARAVLDEQQARPLRVIVDHDQGTVEARMGHPVRARLLFAAAREQAVALGMNGWARRAAMAERSS